MARDRMRIGRSSERPTKQAEIATPMTADADVDQDLEPQPLALIGEQVDDDGRQAARPRSPSGPPMSFSRVAAEEQAEIARRSARR